MNNRERAERIVRDIYPFDVCPPEWINVISAQLDEAVREAFKDGFDECNLAIPLAEREAFAAMPFDDEDLRRLKEDNPGAKPHPDGSCLDRASGIFCRQCELAGSDQAREINALLARLEAAEEVIEDFKLTTETEAPSIRAWRKAAGK